MRDHPLSERASGILLHPTALPGPHGIGTLGRAAHEFADFLSAAGQKLWQVLPLVPTGPGNSPYQSPSSLAGDPALVDLDALAAEGWLGSADLAPLLRLPADTVDYERLLEPKGELLRRAARAFLRRAGGALRRAFDRFRADAAEWLRPHAEFMALKERHAGAPWMDWVESAAPEEAVAEHEFVQFEFFRQWDSLRAYCRRRGVRLIGDMPIFVAHDSADVWRHRDLFDLDRHGRPRAVAGVPPDYFSRTGQLWGNPLYRWDEMERQGFAWWRRRVSGALKLVDVVRIDHFRGLEAFYEIPADAVDATRGRWVKAPGERLLRALQAGLGSLPFIAEDLGFITPEVDRLRDAFLLPGMRVLQFAFSSEEARDPFRPHNYVPNTVAYTGTHDNDTTLGWLRGSPGDLRSPATVGAERERALLYLHSDGREPHWDFIRAVEASVARTAVVPLQDVLGLGSEARFNRPAHPDGNWRWRFRDGALDRSLAARLAEMCRLYGR